MIIKDYQLEKAIASEQEFNSILIYGPNEGLVREKIKIIRSNTKDHELINISGKEIDNDPYLLDQSLNTISMFNTHKLILLENIKDKHVKDFEACDFDKVTNTTMILKDGILSKSSKLRKFFESHKKFFSLACYEDDIKDLMKKIENFSKANSINFSRDIKDYLIQVLGVDRMLNNNELEKILLFHHNNQDDPKLEDVKMLLNDTSANTFQKMNDAVMYGKTNISSKIIFKLISEGVNPVSIIRSLTIYLKRLQVTAIELKKGSSFDEAIKSLRPPIFWKDKENFRSHCKKWNLKNIEHSLDKLFNAEILCKTNSQTAMLICEKTILQIAYRGKSF
tara:strand:- start:706 stop:1713 length:1008 start_codon:yes stop_codon:yes gene_type:complete